MTLTTNLKAAKKFGPGYFIKEQMEYRHWTQEDLSEITGLSLKHVNKIVQDKQPLTLEVAKLLGEIFNTSPQFWLNLDTSYRLWLTEERQPAEIEADLKGMIYERMPIKDMLTKGWLKPFKNIEELKKQVLEYWGWSDLDFSKLDQEYLPCLPRRSEAFNQYNASYAITWYRKATIEASRFKAPVYHKEALESLYEQLHRYTIMDNGIARFLEKLNETGVIFFVLPHLQKTYLDGAAFLLDQTPVIVYTGRYKRLDNFWFTLAHEIAHVLLHLNAKTPFVLDDLKDGEINEIENEANALAGKQLKHDQIMEQLSDNLHYLTTAHIDVCSAALEIHPAIITGKLAYEKKFSFKINAKFNDDVAVYIPKKYFV